MHSHQFDLQPADNHLLQNLCGCHNENITAIEHYFSVQIHHRGFTFKISGDKTNVEQATQTMYNLYENANTPSLSREDIHHTFLNSHHNQHGKGKVNNPELIIEVNKKRFKIKNPNQVAYIKTLQNEKNTITFATGPAGTGKTFLAVLIALKRLKEEKYKRIILTRPVIEAGEQLGFLPGDVMEKTYPYLQPLYDSIYQIISKQEMEKMIDKNIIEIAPLAFMRGRTFNESFIILDEAQNATKEQMKMFLTRIGHHSKIVVTGDDSQTDITDKHSGLKSAQSILQNIEGIDFIQLQPQDIHRHHIVQLITQAYKSSNEK